MEQATSAEASATDDGGWSTAADAASTVKGGDDAGWAEGSTPPASSKQDEFAASGGFGDAPSSKEISKAAKGVQSTPAVKPKMTWAQIAKSVAFYMVMVIADVLGQTTRQAETSATTSCTRLCAV